MRKVVIIGAAGQLGTDCVRAFRDGGWEVTACDRKRADLLDPDALREAISSAAPDVVVNAAAMTDVTACETDPEVAYRINALGPRNLARIVAESSARLLHVSTDYVFDGRADRPYSEGDLPRPVNVYGNTKLAGEYFVLASGAEVAVVRTSGLYGRAICRGKRGRNFVKTMLKLARERGEVVVVDDEIVTPTHALDLAWQLVALADSPLTGIVHATCQGECSWYEFAAAILDLAEIETKVIRTSSAALEKAVARPPYSVLENCHLQARGLDRMPHWRESLRRYLEEIEERPLIALTE